jgi:cell division protein ZapA (FtsZ GTPase activity inhibitor)
MAKDEKKTITVNDVEYDVNDFTDEQKALLNHVQDLDRKLGNAQFNLDQLMVGREAFVQRLAASLETPQVEAAE